MPYEYAVEVTNSFKGLDLVNSVPEELWMEFHNTVWTAAKKAVPKKKKSKKAKWLSKERREVKSKGERERYIQLNAEFQRIAWTDEKNFLSEQCIRPAENNRRVKTSDLFMKTEISREHFAQRWAQRRQKW